ncbi:hypothetical protein DIPPA_31233 [Diplonema papillatum]|nr:hypothetical protein DIPPA_31233 [Diplonema papillatum]
MPGSRGPPVQYAGRQFRRHEAPVDAVNLDLIASKRVADIEAKIREKEGTLRDYRHTGVDANDTQILERHIEGLGWRPPLTPST